MPYSNHLFDRTGAFQRLALDVLHGQVGRTFMLAYLVQRGNVRMVQGGDGPGLALEALAELGLDELQGDATAQAGVAGLIDHTHAALAELLLNLVVGDMLSDGQAGSVR